MQHYPQQGFAPLSRGDTPRAALPDSLNEAYRRPISVFTLLRIVSPKELKFFATITKAPGPPITLLR